MAEQVRKPFIYLAIIAAVFGVIGIFILQQNFSGRAILTNNDNMIKAEDMIKHNTIGDCWVSINNIVYDATFAINNYIEFKDIAGNCGANADAAAGQLKAETLKFLDDKRLGILA